MNVSTMVSEEVLVVMDDYETGEVLFEGSLWELYRFSRHFNVWGFEKSVEWTIKSNRPIALVTVDFDGKLGEFKEYLAAIEEADDDISDEEFEKLESFESWLTWK